MSILCKINNKDVRKQGVSAAATAVVVVGKINSSFPTENHDPESVGNCDMPQTFYGVFASF